MNGPADPFELFDIRCRNKEKHMLTHYKLDTGAEPFYPKAADIK